MAIIPFRFTSHQALSRFEILDGDVVLCLNRFTQYGFRIPAHSNNNSELVVGFVVCVHKMGRPPIVVYMDA